MTGAHDRGEPDRHCRAPGYTAEAAAGRGTRSYRHHSPARRGPDPGTVIPAVSGVSGYYAGLVCLGQTLCVMVEDFDENGNITGWHCVDEIGSC